jgi:short-subunit dehydrogenase
LSAIRYRAVLTGASGGIGRAMALRLAPLCESLLLVGRDAAALAVLARGVQAARGHVRAVAADLTMVSGRDAVLRAASEAGGGVDLLVNNAGAGEFAWLTDQDDAALERIVRVNVLAPMQLTRRLLPLLLAQPAARIVNVGSIFGYLGYPGHTAYCASKFALRGFSEALRRELADGPVQVTYFAPRATRTAMNGAAMCALNAELGVAMDSPESVAEALVALLEKPAAERPLGMPERLFAWLNQVTPRLVDRALLRQLPVIRRYARGHAKPQPLTQGVKS